MIKKNISELLALIAISAVTAGCGGGGGGTTATSAVVTPVAAAPVATTTSYTTVASAGELITYNINATTLKYDYNIVESQFGLTGKTGSGTLVPVGDGTFTTDTASGGRVAILPNGILVASVKENFGGTVQNVPVVGFSNPVTSIAAAAGTYNWVQRSCIGTFCIQTFGTFVARADSTWSSCGRGNLGAGACPTAGGSTGMFNSLGNGRFQVVDNNGSVNIGTAIAFNSNGQNVLILDLKDRRSTGFGTGILVASQQQAVASGAVDGTWIASANDGTNGSFKLTGTNIQYLDINGKASTVTNSVAYNSPWIGMTTSAAGAVGILAGSGVYVVGAGSSYAEIGIKIK